jgi:hypothetical protein
MSDCKSAGIVAVGLLLSACLLLFLIHLFGGSNAGIILFLLPGVWLWLVLRIAETLNPGPITFMLFVMFMSYCWYFILSYFVIKIYRAMFPTIPEAR